MKTRKIISLLALLFLFYGPMQAQNPDCQKYRTGKFQNIESGKAFSTIKRSEKYQVEKIGKLKVRLQVEWINDCSYKLIFIKGNKTFWDNRPKDKGTPDLIVQITQTDELSYSQKSYFVDSPDEVYISTFFIL